MERCHAPDRGCGDHCRFWAVYSTPPGRKRHPAPVHPPDRWVRPGFLPLAIAAFVGSASYLGTIVALPSALSRVYEIDAVGNRLGHRPRGGFGRRRIHSQQRCSTAD